MRPATTDVKANWGDVSLSKVGRVEAGRGLPRQCEGIGRGRLSRPLLLVKRGSAWECFDLGADVRLGFNERGGLGGHEEGICRETHVEGSSGP